eukprot:GFKZ01010102.1.p1 GENE.GFKZ01010102.1~~GFKZ01010102.1.p1  ORF type:complete len:521 (+),score=68.56 GFKZ01010102.1:176-1738(+)
MQQPPVADPLLRYQRRSKPRIPSNRGDPPETLPKIPDASLNPPSPPPSPERPASPPPIQDPVAPHLELAPAPPTPAPSTPAPPTPAPAAHPATSTPPASVAAPAPIAQHVPPPTPIQRVPRVPPAPPATPSTTQPRPRKRFRKKVTGLFGDQTELKKRIEKLLIHVDTAVLYGTPDSERADDEPLLPPLPRLRAPPRPSVNLPLADAVLEKLKAVSAAGMNSAAGPTSAKPVSKEDEMCDDDDSLASFDSPAFTATAIRLVGSREKLKTLKKHMGSLSLQSNERFIEELGLGTSSDVENAKKPKNQVRKSANIVPPKLPGLDSDLESQATEDVAQFSSPVSVDRTAIPAILRRKVKRSDRGYCSADVLRARMQGTSLAEVAASPISHRRGDRRARWRGLKVGKLDYGASSEQRRSRRNRRRLEARQRVDTDSEESSSSVKVRSRNITVATETRDSTGRLDESPDTNDRLSMLLQADAELRKRDLLKKRKRDSGASGEDPPVNGAGSSRQVRPRTRKSSRY